jgi:hypothetical protein
MSLKMVKCPCCGVQIGVKFGLSVGGHLINIVLVFLTGLLWIVPYVLILAVSGCVRCSKCGHKAKQI